jgi:hypothetical protein
MRPDVTLTASYGTDGRACVLEIEPRKDFLQEMVANETLSKEAVDQLLEEIAPRSTWGRASIPLGSNVMSGSCNSGMTFGEYENVSINVSYGFCEKAAKKCQAVRLADYEANKTFLHETIVTC